MSAKKLSLYDKEQITSKIIKHRFDKDREELLRQQHALGDKVYAELFSAKDKELINSLPNGWLKECDCFYAQFGGCAYEVFMSEKRRFPANRQTRTILANYDGVHPFSEENNRLFGVKTDLEKSIKEAKAKIKGILDSVNTLNQLREVWAEITPFTLFLDEKVKSNLPVVVTADLNKELGLPPDQITA